MLRLESIVLPLAGFSLEISAQLGAPVTGLFGPSGSGKTSLLDLVAGLRRPQSGAIRIDDTPLTDMAVRTFVPPRQRGIGYVPQDLALFPHLHVRRNLLYGCRDQGGAGTVFSFDHITDVLEIRPLLKRDVGSLSGGEQQRVALARALLSSPRLLLLDEPLSSLDGRLKSRLIPYFQRIRDEFHVPMIYVTHDPVEIEALCDEVVRLERGQIVAVGPAPRRP